MREIVTALALVLCCSTSPARSQDDRPANQAKGAGMFEVGLWPEEGRPRLVAGTTVLLPRTEPRNDAPTGTAVHFKKGQAVEFGETVYRTLVPGRFRFLKDGQVKGRRFGSIMRLSPDDYYSDRYPTDSFPVRVGEVIDYLQYRAEGTCFVRIRGEVVDADPCPDVLTGSVERLVNVDVKPKTEWWVQVVLNGRPAGWLLVDGKNVRERGRTF